MATPTFLGYLTGGIYCQYANAAGQIYYTDRRTQQTTYALPPGYEDHPNDTWAQDTSKSWMQWNNQRTGRATLQDPNPPPPRTYLDIEQIKADLDVLIAVPESKESIYRKPMNGLLTWIFPLSEKYSVH